MPLTLFGVVSDEVLVIKFTPLPLSRGFTCSLQVKSLPSKTPVDAFDRTTDSFVLAEWTAVVKWCPHVHFVSGRSSPLSSHDAGRIRQDASSARVRDGWVESVWLPHR